MALRDWVQTSATPATTATTATCESTPGPSVATVATVATAQSIRGVAYADPVNDREFTGDPDVERRRAKALAYLEANPNSRFGIAAEAGDPTIVGVAIRGTAYGELEIGAEKYDPFAFLALLDQYGGTTQ
jgi:hypothetical protein